MKVMIMDDIWLEGGAGELPQVLQKTEFPLDLLSSLALTYNRIEDRFGLKKVRL